MPHDIRQISAIVVIESGGLTQPVSDRLNQPAGGVAHGVCDSTCNGRHWQMLCIITVGSQHLTGTTDRLVYRQQVNAVVCICKCGFTADGVQLVCEVAPLVIGVCDYLGDSRI